MRVALSFTTYFYNQIIVILLNFDVLLRFMKDREKFPSFTLSKKKTCMCIFTLYFFNTTINLLCCYASVMCKSINN